MEHPRIITRLRWEHASTSKGIFKTTIFAKFNNEPQEEFLLCHYPDEYYFTEDELIGKTKQQAIDLHFKKDLNYLIKS